MARMPILATYAGVVATLALFIALGSGGAYAVTYLVSSNSQVGPNTIAGHHPPSGYHANIYPGSVNAVDLAAPEGWQNVVDTPRSSSDPCASLTPATFCGHCTRLACTYQ